MIPAVSAQLAPPQRQATTEAEGPEQPGWQGSGLIGLLGILACAADTETHLAPIETSAR